ncbi:MAG: SGNH/GDSL hydrolase family protein [Rhodobacteraceae bacterium]|nr:SGNH/GDSL hydrolase family protein [Paracoccaceae bacterium]
MARVLAFGDSLTWGYKPDKSGRHDAAHRWPEVLESALAGVTVIPEGLNGRTTAYDDLSSPADLNGARLLPTLLSTHKPLDLTVIMLGTNDIYRSLELRDTARGLSRLVEIIRHHPGRTSYIADCILLVAPPPMIAGPDPDVSEQMAARSRALPARIRQVSRECAVTFFDASEIGTPSTIDGVHFEPELSRAIGLALVDPVRAMLEGTSAPD